MSEYGYNNNRAYTTYSAPLTDTSPQYGWRPMIADSEGRKRSSTTYYPTSATTEYATIRLDNYKTSGVGDDRRKLTSPPPDYYRKQELEDFSRRPRFGGEDRWRKPTSPVRDSYRPQEVEEFVTKAQTEPSRSSYGTQGSTYYRPSNTDDYGFNNYNDSHTKPTVPRYKSESPLDNYRTPRYQGDNSESTPSYNYNSSTAPSRANNGTLSMPTSNINEAVQMLAEAARPTSTATGYTRYSDPNPMYTERIDGEGAERRYGKFNLTPRHYAQDRFTTTVDGREAERKYRGTVG